MPNEMLPWGQAQPPKSLGDWATSPGMQGVVRDAYASYGAKTPEYSPMQNSLATLAELASGLSGDHPESVGQAMQHSHERQYQGGWQDRMQSEIAARNKGTLDLDSQRYAQEQSRYQAQLSEARKRYGLDGSVATPGANAAAQMNPYSGQSPQDGAPNLNGPALTPAPNAGPPTVANAAQMQQQPQQQGIPRPPQYILESAAAADAKQPGAGAAIMSEWAQQNRPAALRHEQLANDLLQKEINQGKYTVDAFGRVMDNQTGQFMSGQDGARPIKPQQLTTTDIEKLGKDGSSLASTTEFSRTFKPEYAGRGSQMIGDIDMAAGRNLPEWMVGKGYPEAASWWQGYDAYKAKVRNEMYGAALTPSEQADFEKTSINPGMQEGTIRRNLARQEEIVKTALARKLEAEIASGYDPAALYKAYGIKSRHDLAISAPSDAKSRKVGQVYMTPRGPMTWQGEGWSDAPAE